MNTADDMMYLLSIACMIISAWVARHCFRNGLNLAGWLNIYASAFNAAAFLNFITK